jgi:hypothetical protein
MAWQEVDGRRYYYRGRRLCGRPRRLYVGAAGSPAAELAAAADHLRRLGREVAARERHAERERLRGAEAPLLALCERTDVLTRAALLAAGFHKHDRGPWRRRRREPEPTG